MKFFLYIFFFFLVFSQSRAQKHVVQGKIVSSDGGQGLEGANVFVIEKNDGTVSGTRGQFSMSLKPGTYHLVFSYLGYRPDTLNLNLTSDQEITISLKPSSILTEEIRFSGTGAKQIKNLGSSTIRIDKKNMKNTPDLLGENDPISILRLMPGIQSTGEGQPGLYVRGGNIDQNLILLDGAPIYNPSHLFGIFSVFNSDAVEEIELIKAGIPAEYGGRMSSILKINTRDVAREKLQLEGGIGLLSSRITASKESKKTSFILSGRRTFFDLLSKPIQPLFGETTKVYVLYGYYFYDLNGKFTWRPNHKNRIRLSGYTGQDIYKYTKKYTGVSTNINWGNNTVALDWDHFFNQKISVSNTLGYIDYAFHFFGEQSEYNFSLLSKLNDWHYKTVFTWIPSGKHVVKTGGYVFRHHHDPSQQLINAKDIKVTTSDIKNLSSYEGTFFIQDKVKLTERLTVHAGLHQSYFFHVGPYKDYQRLSSGETDSTVYGNHETIKKYKGFEPRASANYMITPDVSFKMAYSRHYQYLHMVTLSTISLPTDLWVPSGLYVPPQKGDQYSAGVYTTWNGEQWEGSIELFFKDIQNIIRYKNDIIQPYRESLQERFIIGKGEARGAEFLIKKNQGAFTGWLSYTLARVTRQFDEINDGQVFPAKYDRRHDLAVTGTYKISDKWSASAVFVFTTGNALTLPTSRYLIQENIVNNYTDINGYRMPEYHRFDISLTYKVIGSKYNSSWNFSIYNLYNRANPYYIYFEPTKLEGNYGLNVEPKMVSLFPILPSVSWNFNF